MPGPSIIYARELEHVRSVAQEVHYPEFKSRMFIPRETDMPGSGAETFTYELQDGVGVATIVRNYADDVPMSDVQGVQTSTPIKEVATGYQFGVTEMEAAQLLGKNLRTRKATKARKANDHEVDQILAFGRAEFGLGGLINNANTSLTAVLAGAGGDTTWEDKKANATGADEIYADLNQLIQFQRNATLGIEEMTMILLPENEFGIAMETRFRDGSGNSALRSWMADHPGVRVERWHLLDGAGAGGLNRALGLKADAETLSYIVPREWTQQPPQDVNLAVKVPCRSRVGGTIVYFPLAITRMDGL